MEKILQGYSNVVAWKQITNVNSRLHGKLKKRKENKNVVYIDNDVCANNVNAKS